MARSIATVVLAAGAGSRFGGDKLAAPFRGRPLLAHVLDALGGHAGVVVCRRDDEFAPALARQAGFRAVTNPRPELGLSESLRAGLAALDGGTEWALIVLGDQPLLRPEVVEAVVSAAGEPYDLVRPVYAEAADTPGHPVMIHRRAWARADALRGDQGFGAVVARERIRLVPVLGANPDVDTPQDLARLSTLHSRLSAPDA